MPVAAEGNSFFPGRPDPDDFIQLYRHENTNAADIKIHKDHLPQRSEFQRVMEQSPQALKKTGLGNILLLQPVPDPNFGNFRF